MESGTNGEDDSSQVQSEITIENMDGSHMVTESCSLSSSVVQLDKAYVAMLKKQVFKSKQMIDNMSAKLQTQKDFAEKAEKELKAKIDVLMMEEKKEGARNIQR